MRHRPQTFTRQPLLAIALTLATGHVLSQQIALEGQVSVHNSRYNTGTIEYVQEAYITAPFATADNTDEMGRFSLVFVGMESGTTVRVQVEKAGLEVVNGQELQQVVIGRRDPLRIYMAEKSMLAQAQTELYSISMECLHAQRDTLIAQLRSEGKQRAQAIAELRGRLGREITDRFEAEGLLNERIAALEKRLPSFAQELAAQNLDFASDLYVSAYERYKAGDIEGVVALLDSIALENSYLDAMRIQQQQEALDEMVEDLRQRRLTLLRQTIDSYALKAEGLELLFRYEEAAQQYKRIIAIYKENGLDSLGLAEWYDKLGETYKDGGRYSKALDAYRKALSLRQEALPEDHPDLAAVYGSIGLTYAKDGQFEEAEAVLKEYGERLPEKGEPHCNWALYHALRGEDEKALTSLKKAVELGYDNAKWIEEEKAFEGLRGMDVYKELIEELRMNNGRWAMNK